MIQRFASIGACLLIAFGAAPSWADQPSPPSPASSQPPPKPQPVVVDIPDPDRSGMERRVAERIEQARDAVAADTKSAEAWRRLGMVFDAHFALDEARVCYERATRSAPDDFQAVYLLAIVLQRESDSAEPAIESLEKAAALRPDYAPVYYRLGFNLARSGRTAEARKAYEKAVALDDNLAIAHRALGQVMLAAGDAAGAIGPLERARTLMSNDSITQTELARAYRRIGQDDRAAEAMQAAAGLSPIHNFDDPVQALVYDEAIDSNSCNVRSQRMIAAGNFAGAIEQLKIVLEVAPSDPQVHLNIGWAYMASRRINEAITHLTEAVRLQDDLVRARLMLGFLLLRTGQLEDARAQYGRAVEIAPEDTGAHAGLAMVLTQLGDIDAALNECEEAARLDPESADVQIVWGMALERRGELAAAADHYAAALRIRPDYREAQRRMQALVVQLEPGPPAPTP